MIGCKLPAVSRGGSVAPKFPILLSQSHLLATDSGRSGRTGPRLRSVRPEVTRNWGGRFMTCAYTPRLVIKTQTLQRVHFSVSHVLLQQAFWLRGLYKSSYPHIIIYNIKYNNRCCTSWHFSWWLSSSRLFVSFVPFLPRLFFLLGTL
jgi:hypothetical protein